MRIFKRLSIILIVATFVLSLSACNIYTRYKENRNYESNGTHSTGNTSIPSDPGPSSSTSYPYNYDPYSSITDSMKGSTVRFAT